MARRHPVELLHALIGGLVGAGLAKAGISAIVWSGVLKTAAGIVVSPLMGFLLALLLVLIVSWLFVRFSPFAADRIFRNLQFVSASLYSLGHGGNDAQKTMGIITDASLLAGDAEWRLPRAVLGCPLLLQRHGTLAR